MTADEADALAGRAKTVAAQLEQIFVRFFRKNLLSHKKIRRSLSLDNILITKMGWLYLPKECRDILTGSYSLVK
jgi:hypothetical protein